MHKSKLLAASSVMALSSVMGSSAFAQDIEQVVVSASRIQIAGYQQPTPVSVIGAAQLLEAANADVGDTLRQMPSMGNPTTPEKASNGNAGNSGALGVSGVNLRNLGDNRTLILLDAQRFVSPILAGGGDLSIVPNTVVQRVDVVTGGASAAWGSDAVSGVVNIILNKNFTGLKASIDLQDTGQDTRRSYGFTVTNGFDILGGRSHLEWAVTYNDSPNTVFERGDKSFNNPTIIANPLYVAGNHTVPQNVHVTNAGNADVPGGDIITGPLAGIGFGPDGQLYNYHPGFCSAYRSNTVAAQNYVDATLTSSNTGCFGGTANQLTSPSQIGLLSFPLQQGTGFFFGTYKITPDIQAELMLNYGYNRSHSSSLTIRQSAVIWTDNAFLPASLLTLMQLNKVTSFTATSTGTEGLDLNNISNLNDFYNALGTPVTQTVRQLYRAVFSLSGAIGDNWSWNAYAQHSESHLYEVYPHIEITANYANAIDSVTVTAANRGTSGIAIGTIACRSTLSNPTNGCVPLNPLGTGVQTQAGIRYVEDNNDFYHLNIEQDTAGASMQGQLPWDLIGAGAPGTAFGIEYRKDAAVATADPNGNIGALGGGNFVGVRAQVNVLEGFAELDVPIIKNGIVQSLDGSLAGRMTSYSTSGLVETWKLGLTSQVNDDVRLRFTWSYDIRAPNIGELFNRIPASGGQTDYRTGTTVSTALSETTGNPNLLPEDATTYSGGIVLTPHWVPGLTMSFDWYSINVKGQISAPSTAQERQFCTTGVATPDGTASVQNAAFVAGVSTSGGTGYCADWVYNPGLVQAGVNTNGLQFVYTYPFNNGYQTTSGLDFVADYAMDFMGGNLAWHFLGNYNDEYTATQFGQFNADHSPVTRDTAGEAGNSKIKMDLSATYTQGPWSGTIVGRYLGSSHVNNQWTTGLQIGQNEIPQTAYLDLRGSYRWNDNVQFYLTVDNVFDTPPVVTVTGQTGNNGGSTINRQYDTLGRMWHTGVRFSW